MKSLLVPLALLLGLPSAASAGALPWEEPDLALKKSPTTLLELSRSTKKVKVFHDGQVVATFPVAVGRSDAPTPLGEHTVHRMMKNPVWSSTSCHGRYICAGVINGIKNQSNHRSHFNSG